MIQEKKGGKESLGKKERHPFLPVKEKERGKGGKKGNHHTVSLDCEKESWEGRRKKKMGSMAFIPFLRERKKNRRRKVFFLYS